MLSVLVTKGTQSSTLGVVRSLGSANIPVIVACGRFLSPAAHSRYCSGRMHIDDPLSPNFLEAFEQTIANRRDLIWFPTSDDVLLPFLSDRRHLEARLRLAIPDTQTVMLAFNKGRTACLAHSLGCATPKTQMATSVAELRAAVEHIGRPYIVKGTQSIFKDGRGRLQRASTVKYVSTGECPPAAFEALAQGEELVVQEYIPGRGIGVSGLFSKGSPIALFAHARTLEVNPAGGPSAVAESIHVSTELKELTVALMEKIRWTGVAMVEYKEDSRTHTCKLLEINGRFWGSLPLALQCGMDFPRWLYQLANGEKPSAHAQYPIGVRSVYVRGYVSHYLHRLSKRDFRRRSADSVAKAANGRYHFYGSGWHDPLPGLLDFCSASSQALGRFTR